MHFQYPFVWDVGHFIFCHRVTGFHNGKVQRSGKSEAIAKLSKNAAPLCVQGRPKLAIMSSQLGFF